MKVKLIFSIIFLIGLCGSLRAQKGDTITISPIVGNVIDSSEKARHRIFSYYSPEIFIRAVFFRNADSSITLRTLLKPDSIAEEHVPAEDYDWMRGIIEETSGAVNDLPPNKSMRPYDVKIVLMNGEVHRGVLYRVNSTSIATAQAEVPVSDIRSILLIRQNRVSRSAGNGLLIGAGVGMILGLAAPGDTNGFIPISPFGYGIIYGALLALPGMLVGGIVGAFPAGIRISLDGKLSKYKGVHKNLKTYGCEI